MSINDYMTVKEAAYRWGITEAALKERLRPGRKQHLLEHHIEVGRLKIFKAPGAKANGAWILTTAVMTAWYGPEPVRNEE